MKEEKEDKDKEKKVKKGKKKKKDEKAKKDKDKKEKKDKKDKKVKLSKHSSKSIASKQYAEAMKGREIMVSVLVISYNQEKYIGQTLESILEQETEYSVEILVGDDASTDGTPDIIRRYAKEYPHLFRVYCREKNLGPVQNWLDIVKNAKGTYIATLEGDDFWCNKKKLQMQVDFLEVHQEYSCCATGYRYVDIKGKEIANERIPLWSRRESSFACELQNPFVFTLDDYNDCRMPSHISTLVSRNPFLRSDFSIFYASMRNVGDQVFPLILLQSGNIYVMTEKTSCYRFSFRGNNFISMTQSNPFHFYNWYKGLIHIRKCAKRELGLDVTRNQLIRHAIFQIVDSFYRFPTRARWNVLCKTVYISDRKLYTFWMIVQAIYLAWTYPVVRNLYQIEKRDICYRKIYKTWRDFWREMKGKKLVIYGAGGGGEDVLNQYYDRLPVELLVDSEEGKANTWFMGYMIWKPEKLWGMDRENTIILITTAYFYKDIINSLEEHGFHHYYVYPIMERRKWYNKPLDWLQDYIKDIR